MQSREDWMNDAMDPGSIPFIREKVDSGMPLTNGPELWNQILARMPAGAAIAGGCVRDYLLGIEPRDIDVFMSDHHDELREDFHIVDPRAGMARIDNTEDRQKEYTAITGITLVSRGTLFGHQIDAVSMADFHRDTLLAQFDFAINRSMYLDGAIIDTIEARNDRESGRVTLLLGDRMARSQRRFDRFNLRMGGKYRLDRNGF